MRIAMVAGPHVPVPPKKYGGTERVIYWLIEGLRDAGHNITLFAPGDSEVEGVELVPIVDKNIFFGKNKAEQKVVEQKRAIAEEKTRTLLRQRLKDFDIIHSHGFDLIDFQDFPNLTTLHGMFLLSDYDYFEKRKGLYYASISHNQQIPFPDLNFVGVAYNGLNPDDFPVNTKPEDYLTFIGRFDREKNPHEAIQLALALNMKLKLAGKLDFLGETYFEEEIRPHLSNPLIEYLGEIGMEEKVDLLSNAACNLHPTNFREPFGLTILEAAYCGTPTMAVKRGSMPELIEDGRSGILVEDFSEGIQKLEECLQLDRSYIAQRSRMLFNFRTMAHQYEKAYNTVIERFETGIREQEVLLRDMEDAHGMIKNLWPKSAPSLVDDHKHAAVSAMRWMLKGKN